jgi:hypothetical protein
MERLTSTSLPIALTLSGIEVTSWLQWWGLLNEENDLTKPQERDNQYYCQHSKNKRTFLMIILDERLHCWSFTKNPPRIFFRIWHHHRLCLLSSSFPLFMSLPVTLMYFTVSLLSFDASIIHEKSSMAFYVYSFYSLMKSKSSYLSSQSLFVYATLCQRWSLLLRTRITFFVSTEPTLHSVRCAEASNALESCRDNLSDEWIFFSKNRNVRSFRYCYWNISQHFILIFFLDKINTFRNLHVHKMFRSSARLWWHPSCCRFTVYTRRRWWERDECCWNLGSLEDPDTWQVFFVLCTNPQIIFYEVNIKIFRLTK